MILCYRKIKIGGFIMHRLGISVYPEKSTREFDSCLQLITNQIAQNVEYINAFEFFYCQISENKCTNMG